MTNDQLRIVCDRFGTLFTVSGPFLEIVVDVCIKIIGIKSCSEAHMQLEERYTMLDGPVSQ